jgi:hypothetical protein
MLFIHIRSPCKLFYQVSLNFNIQDSASEELEVDQLDFDKIKNLRTEDSNKIIRSRYLSKSPDMATCEKSPKSAVIFSSKKEEQLGKGMNVDRSTVIKERIEKFRKNHNEIIQNENTSKTSKKIGMRKEFIFNMREKMFSKKIVLKVLFNAWKGLRGKLI